MKGEKKRAKRKMMSDSDLKQIAKDLFCNKIFCDRHLSNPKDITLSFPVLLLMEKKDLAKMEKEINFIYEYYDKAGPMAVNGKPIFFSCRTLRAPETEKMFDFYNKFQQAYDSL